MHKLALTTPEIIQAALKQEEARSPQSRFMHRLHCLLLVGMGRSCYEVAGLFGDDPRSVERWVHEFREHGIEGLRDKRHPGRHARLADVQSRKLQLALANSPRELGYAANAWTAKLLRAEILCRFGVTLSLRHSHRLFVRLRRSLPPESTSRVENG